MLLPACLPALGCGCGCCFKLLQQNSSWVCTRLSISLHDSLSVRIPPFSYLIGCCSCRRASPFMCFTYRSRLSSSRIAFLSTFTPTCLVSYSLLLSLCVCVCVWLKLSTKVTQSLINFLRQTQTQRHRQTAKTVAYFRAGPRNAFPCERKFILLLHTTGRANKINSNCISN